MNAAINARALILCVALPDAVMERAAPFRSPDAARRSPLHCALFRHLPGPSADQIIRDVRRLVRQVPPPVLTLAPPRITDRAVVLPLHSPELLDLRAHLAHQWQPMLLAAERAPPRLHITIASGLTRAEADALLARVRQAGFIRRPLSTRALLLFAHGPGGWSPLLRAAFAG